ncbi:DNA pilot protein [Chifec microvirus UA13_14]|nr:DNA pilot protein [Chifec microvirus UA13_14]
MPWIIGGASVLGAGIGASGAKSANRKAIQFSREMAKNKYTYQVQDLKQAGLNPMLAVSNGAPMPSTPQMQNVGDAAMRGAEMGSKVGQSAKLMAEQLNLMRAQGNKAIAEGEESKARTDVMLGRDIGTGVGTGASSIAKGIAEAESAKVTTDTLKVGLQKAQADLEGVKLDNANKAVLQPLVQQYQRFVNEQVKLGLSQAAADAKFWDTVGGAGKAAPTAIQLLKILLGR